MKKWYVGTISSFLGAILFDILLGNKFYFFISTNISYEWMFRIFVIITFTLIITCLLVRRKTQCESENKIFKENEQIVREQNIKLLQSLSSEEKKILKQFIEKDTKFLKLRDSEAVKHLEYRVFDATNYYQNYADYVLKDEFFLLLKNNQKFLK